MSLPLIEFCKACLNLEKRAKGRKLSDSLPFVTLFLCVNRNVLSGAKGGVLADLILRGFDLPRI